MKSVSILLFCLLSAAAYSQTITVQNPIPWIQVTPSTDPAFTAHVDKIIGAEAASQIAYALPYSVVLTNLGDQPVTMLGLVFTVQGVPGTDPFVRTLSYHSRYTPDRPILAPGESQIFTPLKGANAIAAAARRKAGSGGPAAEADRPDGMKDLVNAQAIGISVDLIGVDDGRTGGPDTIQAVATVKAQKAAYAAMKDEYERRIAAGQSNAAIQDWLAKIATQRIVFSASDPITGQVTASQITTAEVWRKHLQRDSAPPRVAPAEIAFPGVDSLKGGLR